MVTGIAKGASDGIQAVQEVFSECFRDGYAVRCGGMSVVVLDVWDPSARVLVQGHKRLGDHRSAKRAIAG